jgi:hypothetical protein
MRAWLLVITSACGGPAQTAPPPAKPVQPTRVADKPIPISPVVFCDRMVVLQHCPWAEHFNVDPQQCADELGKEQWSAFLARQGPCFVQSDDCEAVAKCVADAAVEKTDLRACDDHDPARTVGMPRAAWERRKGANVTRYSAAKSSKSAPVELCGIPAINQWLVDAACDDGSHPFANRSGAESARTGNVGEAGRCGSIVDLYAVKCPEATYQIYLDGYVCPLQ